MEYIDKDKTRLLLNIAYAGCSSGNVYLARKIFNSLEIIYPDSMPVKVGMAFSYIVVNEFAKGEEILNSIIVSDAENYDAKALLAFSYALQKKENEANAIIDSIPEDHESAFNLAKSARQIIMQQ